MEQKGLQELTDQQLLQEAKKIKSNNITNAVFIGVIIGIVIFSIIKNGLGFLTLIPLFIVYKAFNNETEYKAVKKELIARNLK